SSNYKTSPPRAVVVLEVHPERQYSLEDFPVRPKIDTPKGDNNNNAIVDDPFPLRPGDDFNQRGPSVEELLVEAGWEVEIRHKDGRVWLTRPGKDSGTSGSISADGRYFYSFSTSTDFEARRAYSKFAVFTVLQFGEVNEQTLSNAAAQLRESGY